MLHVTFSAYQTLQGLKRPCSWHSHVILTFWYQWLRMYMWPRDLIYLYLYKYHPDHMYLAAISPVQTLRKWSELMLTVAPFSELSRASSTNLITLRASRASTGTVFLPCKAPRRML